MDFALTEEQRMIAASAADWLSKNHDFRQRETSLHRDGGSPATWQAMADLGWLGLPLPDEAGGLAMGSMACGLIVQAMGRHLVVEPFIDCTVQAARLLALTGSPRQQRAWLPGVVDGTHRLALAHTEGARLPWDAPRLLAVADSDGGWVLAGTKRCAASAPGAARWIVSASLADGCTALFLVDPCASGIGIDAYDTSDGGRAADIRFDSVRLCAASRLGSVDSQAALHRVLAEGVVARCWQAAGCMQATLEQTTAYVQQRRQFNQPLAGFQAVQHRLAEMAVACAEAQAACELASVSLDSAGVEKSSAADTVLAGIAKNKVARAARYVSQECVQLHGAMGVCEELPVASAFRALTAFLQWGGDGASHALLVGRALLADGSFAASRTLREALPANQSPAEPETLQ
jgi:alkylation response protein AidB-like acyl-CoA dehydrogenase